MSMESCPAAWTHRAAARWSMPVSLQPRAPQPCRVVQAVDKRPARLSRWGYHLRPGVRYQLEAAAAEPSDLPHSVQIVAGPLRLAGGAAQRSTQDGREVCRFDLRLGGDEDDRSHLWWSRLEPLVVRWEYGDGREDCEQQIWVAVAPRRVWAVFALVGSLFLYGLVPWLSRTIAVEGDLPAVWQRILQLAQRPAVWEGLIGAVLTTWLAMLISDGCLIWLRFRKLRGAVRRDIVHYTEAVRSVSDPG